MLSPPISTFSLDSKPFGHSYSEWSAKWWQWLLSIPLARNPAFDFTGANANINQNNPDVFFCCQTYEGTLTVPNRTVSLKVGRSIFMPIINWVSILHIDGETDEELIETANQRMDAITCLQIDINGTTVKNGLQKYRARSPFFDVKLPRDNILALQPGPIRAVSDGYWLFLKGMESDTKITSFGSCSSGATKIGVNYTLRCKSMGKDLATS